MTESPGQKDWARDIRRLSDPEFFTQWADVRNRLVFISEGKPEHRDIKLQYRALSAEYRRRIDGGFTETSPKPNN
jgi:hypothetical protein